MSYPKLREYERITFQKKIFDNQKGMNPRNEQWKAGGKPSTWFLPERLVELSYTANCSRRLGRGLFDDSARFPENSSPHAFSHLKITIFRLPPSQRSMALSLMIFLATSHLRNFDQNRFRVYT